MKTYFADANIFLRFILQDDVKLAKFAEKHFLEARDNKIKPVFIPEIIIEINYVLEKVYSLTRTEIFKYLSGLIDTPYLEIKDREIFQKGLRIYDSCSVDLVDILLYVRAKQEKGEVLSLDKDFKKLARINPGA